MISLLATLASLAMSATDSVSAPLMEPVSAPALKPVGASPAVADTRSSFERFGRWQFGLSGGNSTGGGLAVRYWLDEWNGFEVHGYAYLSKRTMPDNGGSFVGTTGDDGYDFSGDTGTVAAGELSLGVQYLRQVLKVHMFDANGLFKGPCYLRGLTFVGVGTLASYEDRDLKNSREKYFYEPGSYTTSLSVTPQSKLQYHSSKQELMGGAGAGLEMEIGRFSVHVLGGFGGYTMLPADTYEFGPTVDGGIFVRF